MMPRTGPLRNGPFRLDLDDPDLPVNDNIRWLRGMVESRRRDGVPAHGAVLEGEELHHSRILRTSLAATREALEHAILE